jgi:prepilin-type N-terminal cleavage/methylation domain-containing protein
MKVKLNKGFTLIELLVVISIIGILSVIVLASMNSAKNQAIDGSIKTQLKSLQNQMNLYSSSVTAYGKECNCYMDNISTFYHAEHGVLGLIKDDSTINAQMKAIFASSGANVYLNTSYNGSFIGAQNSQDWVAFAQLKSSNKSANPDYWCVDSTGASVFKDTILTTATSCQ